MQFERIINLIGLDTFNKLGYKKVLLVGCGGVGSYALETLIRSGIRNIDIIDFDKIDITNLNRQLITNLYNIGQYKIDEAKKRALSINLDVNINLYKEFLDENNIDKILNNNYDYVIDACDSINTKINLIINKEKYNYKLISCMGTAKKVDPTKLCITTLDKTSYDHLAKTVRKKLRCLKYNRKVMVVSSIEQTIECDTLGSFMMVPATAGILCAKYVIDDIIKSN